MGDNSERDQKRSSESMAFGDFSDMHDVVQCHLKEDCDKSKMYIINPEATTKIK